MSVSKEKTLISGYHTKYELFVVLKVAGSIISIHTLSGSSESLVGNKVMSDNLIMEENYFVNFASIGPKSITLFLFSKAKLKNKFLILLSGYWFPW